MRRDDLRDGGPIPGRREGGGDILAGLPRGSLRAAFRKAAAGAASPVRSPAASPGLGGTAGRMEVREEDFGLDGSFPTDLFGPRFRWTPEQEGAGIAFLDLETCGLGDSPIFLAGILRPRREILRLSRGLALDPSGEPSLLRWAAGLLGEGITWVTFNGRSFDAPRLRRRASVHGIEMPLPGDHLDLLLAVRRRWKSALPDCRLGTVERRLLGLERRAGDVPGREVPERYADFVRTGNYRWIDPVLEHNRRDVTAMAVLLHRMKEQEG
jgi:uncharacterized protein YprB with RNaseH-like and TPR domain